VTDMVDFGRTLSGAFAPKPATQLRPPPSLGRPCPRLNRGTNIVAWRGKNPVTLFTDHKQMVRSLAESTAIRSNGHAWCTADDNLCVGNDIERTRCSDCSNAVIGLKHAQLYQGLHDRFNEVRQCDDIGEVARTREQPESLWPRSRASFGGAESPVTYKVERERQ